MRAFRISDTLTFVPLRDEEGDFGLLFDSSDNTVSEVYTQQDLRNLIEQAS